MTLHQARLTWRVCAGCGNDVVVNQGAYPNGERDMTEKVDWMMSLQVAGGPKVSATKKVELATYSKVAFGIKQGKSAQVQLGAGALNLLFVNASDYTDDQGHKVKYTPDSLNKEFTLDAPLMVVSEGTAALLGDLKKLSFKNELNKDITIEIMASSQSITWDA